MKLYKVINHAIENRLQRSSELEPNRAFFSCQAVYCSIYDLTPFLNHNDENRSTFNGYVKEMVYTYNSTRAYEDIPLEDRQQARALWLTWVSMIAKEEGIEI